jgi:uncharacterized protein (TIGR04255 family)
MGTPLKTPPVYFTLAQVRFNPILKLADYVPSIQESFRRAAYPAFESQMGFSIKITVENGQPKPVSEPQQRFAFGDAEQTHRFLLDMNSLALQSTDYGRFEVFAKRFEEGLERVHESVTLDFIERVGLRYLNKVSPLEGDALKDYLTTEAMGLRAALGGESAYSYCETLTAVSGVKLLSRALTQTGPTGFPPDIGPVNLELLPRFRTPPTAHAMLDTDGFVERRVAYAIAEVHEQLAVIHDVLSSAFIAITTDHARAMWNK